MRFFLVYDAAETVRNQSYIGRWRAAAQKRGVEMALVHTEDLSYGILDNRPFFLHQGLPARPDFAVMRCQRPLLSAHLESMGVPVFNNAFIADVCNDKRKTHAFLQGLVPMMDTAFVEPDTFVSPFPCPVVVKGSHSSGGRRVFLCRNDNEYRLALAQTAPDSAVVQPVCDTPGKDVRVYVLGDRIIKTMMRQSDDDFRSNIGQGGNAVPYELDAETLRHVERIAQRFDFGLVGVDFLFHRGRLLFNEIEDAVGARMLYIHTEIDIADEYLGFILTKLSCRLG